LTHCPLGIVVLTLDREQYLVHLPLVTGPRAPATGLVGIGLAIGAILFLLMCTLLYLVPRYLAT